MRSLLLFALLLASGLAHAQQAQDFGTFVVHYSTMPTEMVAPEVARTHGITRSASRVLLNVAVLRKADDGLGVPMRAEVSATATNLNGQLSTLRMREVREERAIYYLGELRVTNEETFDFEVRVTPEGGDQARTVRFRQQFFTR
jgi:transposase-like protein